MKEYTVQERWALVKQAFPVRLDLSKKTSRMLEEVLYTANQAGMVERIDGDSALLIWQLVELAKTGKVTAEMRL